MSHFKILRNTLVVFDNLNCTLLFVMKIIRLVHPLERIDIKSDTVEGFSNTYFSFQSAELAILNNMELGWVFKHPFNL